MDGQDSKRSLVTGKKNLILLPLRDIVVFPHMMIPLFVGREKSICALNEAVSRRSDILLVTQKKAHTNHPGPEDLHSVGTIGSIVQMLRLKDDTIKVLIEGHKRAQVQKFLQTDAYFEVEAEPIEEKGDGSVEVEALMRGVKELFEAYVKLNKRIPPEMLIKVAGISDPSLLADTIVVYLNLKIDDKQRVLEELNPVKRLESLMTMIESEIEVLQVERKIRTRLRKQMDRNPRDLNGNDQINMMQRELGDRADEAKNEIVELEQAIRDRGMTKEATDKALNEIKKLKMMSPMSAEATVIRNFLDWALNIPWHEKSTDKINLEKAQAILDNDHFGLEKVKERIMEFLAVQKMVGKLRGPILCLVGPPGVGKTSLGKSIAEALGRKYVRASLGGVRDEAEIRGHRRTYIGAMPGKIVQSMKKAGTINPVFLLDEIDKMNMDFRGDPASALLEVLDPEQNAVFNDHYLEVDYDLSKVMFVATANSLSGIPRPLLDRLEIIQLSGYTEEEKFEICKKYLVPKQMKFHGLEGHEARISEDALMSLIREYTREAGVRNLEREIASLCRKLARQMLSAKRGEKKNFRVTAKNIESYLGPGKFRVQMIDEGSQIGVTNGLAWTETGGDTLAIEVTTVPGKGGLKITGKLGEVMQESAHAAMSYVRSIASDLGLKKDLFQNIDIHIHVPEGAIPKDGPSAGVTIATSITSALTQIGVRQDVAMTGEITLRGRVLPIGGLKEKILAAKRAGIKSVIIPKENERDLKELPKNLLKNVTVTATDSTDEVLARALNVRSSEALFKGRPKKVAQDKKRRPAIDSITCH